MDFYCAAVLVADTGLISCYGTYRLSGEAECSPIILEIGIIGDESYSVSMLGRTADLGLKTGFSIIDIY